MLRYFEFSGRSTRRQYWLFWLVASVMNMAAIFADHYLYGHWPVSYIEPGPFFAFSTIIHIIPGITVSVRRLHDSDRSGWWYFIQMAPLLGTLLFLYWMIRGPEQFDNRFGPDPRDAAEPGWSRRQARTSIPRSIRMGSNEPPLPVRAAGEAQRFI